MECFAGSPETLRSFWKHVVDRTFNAISVDGDTSTNDTVLLLANGSSGLDPSRDGATWKVFEEAVTAVARTLALAVVEDGEGATKCLEIAIVGAQTETHAREVGRAIARSTLVKTAIYGGDPNWGRVLAAAGVAGVALVAERITLHAQSVNGGGWLTLASGGATASAGGDDQAHRGPEHLSRVYRVEASDVRRPGRWVGRLRRARGGG